MIPDHGAGAVEAVAAVDEGTAVEQQPVDGERGIGAMGVEVNKPDAVGVAEGPFFFDGYAGGIAAVAVEADDGGNEASRQYAVQLGQGELG